MEMLLLGPVQAVRLGREVRLGGPKQRAVLALLLVDPGRVVPAANLIEALWPGEEPPGARGTLRSYVSRLRTALGADAPLIARGGGYAITVAPGQVDSVRFEGLVKAGQDALTAGEPAAAASPFAEALALWRGPALADVAEVEPLAREAARLEELRLTAVEGGAEAELALGRHAEVVGELERLVAEYPLRERLWRLLVLALYRAERQADALAAYRRAREMLATELGLEPGQELRRMEQAVLRQDVPAPPLRARHNLPSPLTSFVGRDQDLAALGVLVGEARLVTLTGTGGTGKTRLALELAAGIADRFGDGVWLADLAGISDAALVAAQVMTALGVRQTAGMPVIEALRYRLRSAELLLVLDNCEHMLEACAELAGELLRSSPGLRVLATSREPVGIPGEVVYMLQPLAVPPESADAQAAAAGAAVRLFLDRASAARGGASARVAPIEVAGRICRALDGLPLAIELAAARMGTLSAAEIEAQLADRFRFLAYRRPVADRRHQALQAAIDWSYDLLTVPERVMFAELSVFAGGFGLAQVAEVCAGGDRAAALEVIDRLAAKSLVTADPSEHQTRYRLLETVRQYAADRLAETGQARAALQLHAGAFLRLAKRERKLAALALDHDNFRAALEWSLASRDSAGPLLARALGDFWLTRGLLLEARAWLERALARSVADEPLRAELLRLLGTVLFESGELAQSKAVLADSLQVAAAAGLAAVQARIRVRLIEVHGPEEGNVAGKLAECAAATKILDAEGDLEGLAEAWTLAGTLRFWTGDPAACQDALSRAAEFARRSGNHYAETQAQLWLAISYSDLHVPADEAISRLEQLLQSARGEPWTEANTLMWLAIQYGYAGRFADARRTVARSQQLVTQIGAKYQRALGAALIAGQIELIAGNLAAAEHHIRDGYQTLRDMGEHGYRSTITCMLAEAVYAQGRFGEAERLTEEARAIAAPDDIDVQARWRTAAAKLHARRGEFATARRLLDEAQELLSPTSLPLHKAEALTAKAEVNRLAGAPDDAAASLRTALRIYQDRRAVALADNARTALASLAAHPGRSPA
jgi:predicted ATPase/DNA-binding SARP family transcriptional activator